jgi:hypothetical protein
MEKLKRRQFTGEFKIEGVKLGSIKAAAYPQAGKQLEVLAKLIQGWAKEVSGWGVGGWGAPPAGEG